jgi:hypothetical protein
MKKVFTIDINDEPLIQTSTGQRQATITYTGKRYVYTEVCMLINKTYALVHASDTNTEEDEQIAQNRLTQEEGRVIMLIDAEENPITACIITDQYTMTVDNYVEELPNGNTWTYDYPQDPGLRDIFDIINATFDPETKNYSYKYLEQGVTDEEFIKSIDDMIKVIDETMELNEYTDEELPKITAYRAELENFKDTVDGTILNHKLILPMNPLLLPPIAPTE